MAKHEHRKYRLNPYYFLADRKIWMLVAILLLGLSYAVAIHSIAMAAGYQGGSRQAYWLAVIPLACVPVALHVIAPWLESRSKRAVVAAWSCERGSWITSVGGRGVPLGDDASDLQEHARSICRDIGVDVSKAKEIVSLWLELPAVYSKVLRHAANVAGRDPLERSRQKIRVVVTAGVGSPYCYALALGSMTVVIPLGATPAEIEQGPGSEATSKHGGDASRFMRYVLAHELSHFLLRDEPTSLFADARLVSVASALQAVVASLLLTTFSALFMKPPSTRIEVSSYSGAWVSLVLAGAFIALPLLWRALFTEGAVASRARPASLIAAAIPAGALCVAVGGVIGAHGLVTTATDSVASTNWLVVYIMIALAAALGQVCVHLGRRQMEFMADENAINSLVDDVNDPTALRHEASLVLTAAYDALTIGTVAPAPPPRFAVGHNDGVPEARRGVASPLRRRLRSMQQRLVDDGGLAKQILAGGLGVAVSAAEAIDVAWSRLLFPMVRSHPTLLERIGVVQNPDLQVQQSPSIPLIYATLPVVAIPYLAQRLVGTHTAGSALSSALVWPPILIFLALFSMVARRPALRRGAPAGSEPAVDVGFVTLAHLTQRDKAVVGPGEDADVVPVASGLRGELGPVAISIGIAGLMGMVVVTLVERAAGGSGGGVALPLLLVELPPLPPLGAVLAVTGLFFSFYMVTKFFSLAQWHYYEGTTALINAWHHLINIIKAWFIFSVGAGALILLAVVIVPTGTLLLPRRLSELIGSSPRAWVVGDAVFGYVGAVVVVLTLIFAIAFAAVITWWPSLPQTVRCPAGHLVPMRWISVLWQPERSPGRDWAWLRCPECQRSPQLRRLLCDEDREAPSFRRSSAGWFVLVTIVALAQLAYPSWALASGLAKLDALGRCRQLAAAQTAEQRNSLHGFDDCLSGTQSVPMPPQGWATIVGGSPELSPAGGDVVVDTLAALEDARGEDALVPLSLDFPWTCFDWLAQVRTEVAYIEACAQTAPMDGESVSCDTMDSADRACRCLFAEKLGGGRRVPDVAVRMLAARRLNRVVHSLLHDGARAPCAGHVEVWAAWHKYIEQQLTPRLFMAIASSKAPAHFFTGSFLAEMSEECTSALSSPVWHPEGRAMVQQEVLNIAGQLKPISGESVESIRMEANVDLCGVIEKLWSRYSCKDAAGSPECSLLKPRQEECEATRKCVSPDDIDRFEGEARSVQETLDAMAAVVLSGAENQNQLLSLASIIPMVRALNSFEQKLEAVTRAVGGSRGVERDRVVDRLKSIEAMEKSSRARSRALLGRLGAIESLSASDEVSRHLLARCSSRKAEDRARCEEEAIMDVLRKMPLFSDWRVLPRCLVLGAQARQVGLRMTVDDEWRQVVGGCDWSRQWSEALVKTSVERGMAVPSAQGAERSRMNGAPGDGEPEQPPRMEGSEGRGPTADDAARKELGDREWQVLTELADVARWYRDSAAGLPEYFDANFPMVRRAWGLTE